MFLTSLTDTCFITLTAYYVSNDKSTNRYIQNIISN